MRESDARLLSIAALNERRRRAVKLRLGGMTLREAARAAELAVGTVIAAERAYQAGGWSAVAVRPRGSRLGDHRRLSREQERQVRFLVSTTTPDQLGLAFALWSRAAVTQLIKQRFNIALPVRTMGHYLKRWGFTPQRPQRRFYEQDPQAVERWLTEEYPQIEKRARAERAEIHWGDESGLRSDDVRARGYGPRGITPQVAVNSQRAGLTLISAVTNRGEVRWQIPEGAANAEALVEFLKRLTQEAKRKVFLIWDRLPAHRSVKVREWVSEHHRQIEVFYLPAYSPELNPDELLNAHLKQALRKAAPSRSKQQLKKFTLGHMRSMQKKPALVRGYFRHPAVRYAA
jgi:transposase